MTKENLNLDLWTSPPTRVGGGPKISKEQVQKFVNEVKGIMRKINLNDVQVPLTEFNKIYQKHIGLSRNSSRGLGATRTSFGKMCEDLGLRVRGIVNTQGHYVRMTLLSK